MKVGDLITRYKAHTLHGQLFGTIINKKVRNCDGTWLYKVLWNNCEVAFDPDYYWSDYWLEAA